MLITVINYGIAYFLGYIVFERKARKRRLLRVLASDLMGLGSIPSSKPACLAWLKRMRVTGLLVGNTLQFKVADLPNAERQAYLARSAAETGLPMGVYDEGAHEIFWAAPASMRQEAERKAAMACLLVSLGPSARWADRLAIMQERFDSRGTSKPSLKRLLRAVEDVDPINYAPALLAKYDPPRTLAPVSDAAWSFFMTIIRDAAPEFPIIQAWRDVRDIAAKNAWDWPPYVTIIRRWNALPEAQKLAARHGIDATAKRLAQPVHRDKTTIAPLEWVSLDGRTLDFWTDMGDGTPKRLTMLALVDVASNMVLDYELAASENAIGTVRLIRRTCETFGIFDRLYTDNGSSFAGHLVAGGNVHRFRNKATMNKGVKPLGICYHLGINIHFALPGNAQAKIAERTFASLSRVIDDRPEFKGAHAGHNPGAAPDSDVMPVPFDQVKDIIRREVSRYNVEAGRSSQGAKGRSYRAVFDEGLAARIVRRPTARQLYLSSLIYTPVSVDRNGQVKVDGWIYGSPTTQGELLPFHGAGKRILLGRDPDELSAPAMAFDEDGRLICEGIEYVVRGAYDSVDGIRAAARNRKAARDAASKADAANNYMAEAEFAAALAALDAPEATTNPPPAKVVGGRFGGPLRETKTDNDVSDDMLADYRKNLDAHLAALKAKGEKLA